MKFRDLPFIPSSISPESMVVAAPGPSLIEVEYPVCPIIAVNRAYQYLQLKNIEVEAIATSDSQFVRYYLKNEEPPYHNFAYRGHLEEKDGVPLEIPGDSGAFGIYVASLYSPKKIYLVGFGSEGHYYDNLGGFKEDPFQKMIHYLIGKGIETIAVW